MNTITTITITWILLGFFQRGRENPSRVLLNVWWWLMNSCLSPGYPRKKGKKINDSSTKETKKTETFCSRTEHGQWFETKDPDRTGPRPGMKKGKRNQNFPLVQWTTSDWSLQRASKRASIGSVGQWTKQKFYRKAFFRTPFRRVFGLVRFLLLPLRVLFCQHGHSLGNTSSLAEVD